MIWIIYKFYWPQVTTLGRRESTIQNEKLVHKIVNFDNLRGTEEAFKDHDVAICTLGEYVQLDKPSWHPVRYGLVREY